MGYRWPRTYRNFSKRLDVFLFISAGGADERDELCPSMYSFHSSLEEKNQLLHTLTTYGIETTVDRSKKKDRIREWIQSSAIVEENEGDESDMCEDSEFYEDEDRDIDGNESEEAEPVSMRGRHFPERRPSAPTNELGKKRKSRVAPASSKNRAAAKPVERKIPFAPQVAEERETIARYASFPNGDPNFAAVRNGSDRSRVSATPPNVISDVSANNNLSALAGNSQSFALPPSANSRAAKNLAKTNVKSSQDDSSYSASTGDGGLPIERSPSKTRSGTVHTTTVTTTANDTVTGISPTSPQIPSRKNRAHTAPFSSVTPAAARSAERDRAGESARRTRSATVLRTTTETADNPTVAIGGNDFAVAGSSAAPRSSVPSVVRGAAAILAETLQPPNSAVPASLIERSSPPPIGGQIVTTPTNALLSHSTMQSFNALQGVAGGGDVGTPPSTDSPASSSSNVNRLGQRLEETTTVTYGKDAYQHYGIAQGAILPIRVDTVRQNSTGSGSRSVSN